MSSENSQYIFYTCGGRCFHPSTIISTDKGEIPLEKVKQSTIIYTNKGPTMIKKLIKMKYKGNLYKVRDMLLSPYHPVRVNGSDYFPIDIAESVIYYEGIVIDVILENRGLICSDESTYAATWGHNESSHVFVHTFFGTDSIVDQIYKVSDKFEVNLPEKPFLRDIESNMVYSIDPNLFTK